MYSAHLVETAQGAHKVQDAGVEIGEQGGVVVVAWFQDCVVKKMHNFLDQEALVATDIIGIVNFSRFL